MTIHRNRRVTDRGPRLARKTQRSDGCWLFTGFRNANGYGVLRTGRRPGKLDLAHRVAWELANERPVPKGGIICHHCDNPPCVRSDHLYLGTPATNAADKAARGRVIARRGEASHLSRLTEDQIRMIRVRYAVGARSQDLALDYGITRQGVWRIVTRKAWSHVA